MATLNILSRASAWINPRIFRTRKFSSQQNCWGHLRSIRVMAFEVILYCVSSWWMITIYYQKQYKYWKKITLSLMYIPGSFLLSTVKRDLSQHVLLQPIEMNKKLSRNQIVIKVASNKSAFQMQIIGLPEIPSKT